jgi:hypothetical protein
MVLMSGNLKASAWYELISKFGVLRLRWLQEVQDGYHILYDNQHYWLPKILIHFSKK